MQDGIPIYASRSTKITNLIARLIIIALPIGLSLYGWFFQDRAATLLLVLFGVVVAGCTLVFIHKAKILRFDSAPILIIRSNGLDVPGDTLLAWHMVREAIVFTFEGGKMIGFRLCEDLPPATRSELEAHFGGGFYWQRFGMPVALPYSGVSLSGEELLKQLRARGVRISVASKAIAFGHESELT